MAKKRRKRKYKFTDKKRSKKGLAACGVALVSLLALGITLWMSYQANGEGSVYLGSVGIAAMLVGIASFLMAMQSLKEENTWKKIPITATVLSIVAAGSWVLLYAAGFLL